MKEVGGYFQLEQLIKNEYYKDLISLNTARNALVYLMKTKQINKLYIPYYLCSSVSETLEKHGYDFEYYYIDKDFIPILNKSLGQREYLYIVNYYGQLSNNKVYSLKKQYERIILDNTHAFFQRPIDEIDTIYSCRKFFGVPDGAYLSTDKLINEKLETDISKDRMTHILGRFEGNGADYYANFLQNEEGFKNEPLKYMSNLTKNILGAIDYQDIIRKRNENYQYLDNKLRNQNRLELIIQNGPFAYPFYTENGVEIRKKLAEKRIYIATLWPDVLVNTLKGSIEYDYVLNILPLPCDQRYNLNDINYMIDALMRI